MPYPIPAPGGAGIPPKVPATLIVAASDSKDTSRADYVCDGTDDQEEINQAISDLPASGGRVVLLEGTYNLSGDININKSNVTLEGQGFGSNLNFSSGKLKIAANKVIVRNIQTNGTIVTNSGVIDVEILSCYITGSKGIWMYSESKSIITDCIIENCSDIGILIEESTEALICSNLIKSCDKGIEIKGSENCITTNNYISNCTIGILLSLGLFGVETNDVIVSNNAIFSSTTGISVETDVNRVLIGVNKFYNCTTNITNSSTNTLFDKISINKGNTSSVTVTETSETLKQSVSPDLNFMYYVEGIHVIANNPSGSGVTLYFKVKAELDDGSEVELSSQSVSEGDSFDSWLRWAYDSVTNQKTIKSIKLYAYCSNTPASGSEPTVQLERVTGLQG